MLDAENAGWICTDVCGVVRFNGEDHIITVPFNLLVGDIAKYAEQASAEHQLIAMQNFELGNTETANHHIGIARDLSRWLDSRPSDRGLSMLLLCGDPLVADCFMFSKDAFSFVNAERYAEKLLDEYKALLDERGQPPVMKPQFLFVVSGCNSKMFVTKRLLTVAICKGEIPVKLVGREELDGRISGMKMDECALTSCSTNISGQHKDEISLLPIYTSLRNSFDSALTRANERLRRNASTVSERIEEILITADALIEEIGEAESRGNRARIAELNEQYKNLGGALIVEGKLLKKQKNL